MKRLGFLAFAFLLFAGGMLWAEEPSKTENMSSFMGMRWGLTKASFGKNFKDQFKRKRNEFKDIMDLRSLELFKNPTSLIFSNPATGESSEGSEEEESSPKVKSGDLILTAANIKIDSDKFEDLLEVFKIKYGDPTKYDEGEIQNMYGAKLIQKIATWDNPQIGRSIIMKKFGDLNQGVIQFVPYKSEEEKQRELDKLMKERQERLEKAASVL